MANLYAKMGGFDAVRATVDLFYSKVLEDELLGPIFEGKDMRRMRCMFRQFMVYAWGGSDAYRGKDMKEAHRNLDLTEEHFSAVTKHFEASLQHLGVPPHIISEVLVVLETSKTSVLKKYLDDDPEPPKSDDQVSETTNIPAVCTEPEPKQSSKIGKEEALCQS